VTRPRPPLYALESAGRRSRRPTLPRVPWLRLVAVLTLLAAAGACAAVVSRVWPLVEQPSASVRPAAAGGAAARGDGGRASPVVRGGEEGGEVPAGIWSGRVSFARVPGVAARAGAVVDGVTGQVLWARRPHRRMAIASLTKMMTAMLAAELPPRRRVRVPGAVTGLWGSSAGLRRGQRVSVRRLMSAALVASANDAAVTLAVARAGSVPEFVRLMNRHARRWELRDTRFSNPSGLIDRGNRSSAWDVAAMARRLLARPALARLVRARVVPTGPTSQYVSHNELLWEYPGAIGVKTGFTYDSGYSIAAAARRGRRVVIAVALGGRDEVFDDAARLLDWGFRHGRR
jgi:D-alanyl-D-alanine carboxypeptidase (penicillin-binding protein 5/6)